MGMHRLSFLIRKEAVSFKQTNRQTNNKPRNKKEKGKSRFQSNGEKVVGFHFCEKANSNFIVN